MELILSDLKGGKKPPSVPENNPTNGNAPVGPLIPSAPPTLFSALRSLYVHIANNSQEKGVVAPRAFVEKLKKENELFRSTMHQDAHEFLNYLLNKVAEDLGEEERNISRGSSREDCTLSCYLICYMVSFIFASLSDKIHFNYDVK